jgi:hypothetical protein
VGTPRLTFYLGTPEPAWLGRTGVPLFVSRRRLARLRQLPRAVGPWALDSGGFSELTAGSTWSTPARTYAAEVRRWAAEIGRLVWAAPQDWMCEPIMLRRTGLSVGDHQARTLASVLELRALEPALPWAPVLQGWTVDDYRRHADAYQAAGVDLAGEPLVGLGSVCRRQGTEGRQIAAALVAHVPGLRLHGFGVKVTGLARGAALVSADSMAWSFQARRHGRMLPGCQHARCSWCLAWALVWRARVVGAWTATARQGELALSAAP